MGTGATRQRLWNLSLFRGAQGDVMNGHLCDQAEIMDLSPIEGDQAEIMESITTRGHPRGCCKLALEDQVEIMEFIVTRGCSRGCYELALV